MLCRWVHIPLTSRASACERIAPTVEIRTAQSAPPLGVRIDDAVAAWPLLGPRVSARTAQRAVGVATVPMVALTIWLALSSDHLAKPLASALYWSYLTAAPIGIGLYWWVRRPTSRFGPLLVTLGLLA